MTYNDHWSPVECEGRKERGSRSMMLWGLAGWGSGYTDDFAQEDADEALVDGKGYYVIDAPLSHKDCIPGKKGKGRGVARIGSVGTGGWAVIGLVDHGRNRVNVLGCSPKTYVRRFLHAYECIGKGCWRAGVASQGFVDALKPSTWLRLSEYRGSYAYLARSGS